MATPQEVPGSQWLSYPMQLLGGVNGADAENAIGETEFSDAMNMLCERGMTLNRPGLSAASQIISSGAARFAKSFRLNSGGSLVSVAVGNGHAWRINPIVDLGAFTFGLPDFDNAAAVNGVVLIGNVPGGIVRLNPATNAVSQLIPKYRYVYSHLSRAIAAYDPTTTNGPITFAWSVTGDETNWTGVGSGSAVLSDAPDEITGLCTIRNVIVILRRGGMHLGYATGVSLPAFRFETYQRDGAGCNFPSTVACEDNLLCYVGQDDVWTFNLMRLESIGGKIRFELFGYIDAGVLYRGFISRSVSSQAGGLRRPRLRYNLVPTQSGFPHFVYDFLEQRWTRHQYGTIAINGGFYFIRDNGFEDIALFDGSGNFFTWDTTVNCESPGFILTRVVDLEPLDLDWTLHRVLLKYQNLGATDGVTVTAYSMLNNLPTSSEDTQNIGTDPADAKWCRRWFTPIVKGNDFQVRIDVPPGVPFATNALVLKLSRSGEYKGEFPA